MADPAAILPAPESSVPGVGVGTWAWGNQFLWGYDPAQDETLAACFRCAVELGLTFFDTADSYGTGRYGGRSESLLGDFVEALPPARRQRLTVATKLAPFPWRLGRRGFEAAFEASRRRLRGHLDRVQLHWSTARYAPWQEGALLEGLADLVAEGRVGSLGVSNLGPRRLRRVHEQLAQRGLRLASLQVQLSLLAPEALADQGVAPVCRELGIELLAYSPLALGLLAQSPGRPGRRCLRDRGACCSGACGPASSRCCRPWSGSPASTTPRWRPWRSTGAGPTAPCPWWACAGPIRPKRRRPPPPGALKRRNGGIWTGWRCAARRACPPTRSRAADDLRR